VKIILPHARNSRWEQRRIYTGNMRKKKKRTIPRWKKLLVAALAVAAAES
jgi:hypothetical protein